MYKDSMAAPIMSLVGQWVVDGLLNLAVNFSLELFDFSVDFSAS
jgi:hypothetical protein